MSDLEVPSLFRPPLDWEKVYAANPDGFRFGEEPSALARTALRFFLDLGGDPAQAKALDLGCGEGRDTIALAKAGMTVVARDIAPTGLTKLARRLAQEGIPRDRVDAAIQDVCAFEAPPETFDLGLAVNVFQFLSPSEAPLQIVRLQEMVKPGGLCAIGVFSATMLSWGADLSGLFSATPDELMAFFPKSAGWMLLDRTEYWTYRTLEKTYAAFTYVVFRKGESEG